MAKSLAEFAAQAAKKVQFVFGRGMYVDENTSQAASVELVRKRRTNYARSRLQKTGGKAQRAFLTSEAKATDPLRRLFAYAVVAAAFSGFMGARVEMACL